MPPPHNELRDCRPWCAIPHRHDWESLAEVDTLYYPSRLHERFVARLRLVRGVVVGLAVSEEVLLSDGPRFCPPHVHLAHSGDIDFSASEQRRLRELVAHCEAEAARMRRMQLEAGAAPSLSCREVGRLVGATGAARLVYLPSSWAI